MSAEVITRYPEVLILDPQQGIDDRQRTENIKYGILEKSGEFVGVPDQFGVQYLGNDVNGCNVAMPFGEAVDRLDVCRVDTETGEVTRFGLRMDRGMGVATGFVTGLKPGDKYYLRAGRKDSSLSPYVDYDNEILDPYARAIDGDVVYAPNGEQLRPRSVVVPSSSEQKKVVPLIRNHKILKEVIYECHVVGMTAKAPNIPNDQRGTYAGLAHESIIKHLKDLHVTTIQIMPVQHFHANQRFLVEKGLKNYWGYNTIGFFAPHEAYSSDTSPFGQVTEYKEMVSAYHEAGIKVIQDVVYNHTGEETDSQSSMLFNALGIDDFYHKIRKDGTESFANWTGCGNTINTSDDVALKTIIDSLEYWAGEMGVDGFRFDLTPPLMREGHGGKDINVHGKFMMALMEFKESFKKRTGRELTLIFEPWADGMCDPQVFSDYGHAQSKLFRDSSRLFPRGHVDLSTMATILSGSHIPLVDTDYEPVNFVTCHDGFGLDDVVSFNIPHNFWPNGTPDGDGERNNNSYNWGSEGDTNDPSIKENRHRAKRAMVTLMALAKGLPMISHGDELSCSQAGNNNAYNQANELTMRNWELDDNGKKFLEYFKDVFGIVADTPALNNREGHKWIRADAAAMSEGDWTHHYVAGLRLPGVKRHDADLFADDMIIYINRGNDKVEVTTPSDGVFDVEIDSYSGRVSSPTKYGSVVLNQKSLMLEFSNKYSLGQTFTINPGSIIVARRVSRSIKLV